MTYTWLIKVILKSGKELYGIYNGTEINSDAVANKLFANKMTTDITGMQGFDKTENVFFLHGEIAAFSIKPY